MNRRQRAQLRQEQSAWTAMIRERIGVYLADRDPDAVLAADPAAVAQALVATLTGTIHAGAGQWRGPRMRFIGQVRRDAISALADYYWARHLAGAPAEDNDYYLAANLYTLMFSISQLAAPPELRELMLAAGAHLGAGPAQWLKKALPMAMRAWSTADTEALRTARDLARLAAAFPRPDLPRRGAMICVIETVWLENVASDLHDIDRAITRAESILDSMPPGREERKLVRHAMAAAYGLRSRRGGRPEDLDEAIRLGREGLAAEPDPQSQTLYTSLLTRTLQIRFEETGATADIEEAIAFGMRTISSASDDNLDRPMHLRNLALALMSAFVRTKRVEQIDAAIEAMSESLRATPAGHPWFAENVANLAHANLLRFLEFNEQADIDRSVAAAQEALDRIGPGDPNRPLVMRNLAAALMVRHGEGADPDRRSDVEVRADPDDLARTVGVLGQAIGMSTEGTPDHTRLIMGAGYAHWLLYSTRGDDQDLQRAFGYWRQAGGAASAPASTRASAAQRHGDTAASVGLWSEAVAAYATAVRLLSLIALRGLDRPDGEELMARWSGMASDAAASAIQVGDPLFALDLLEQGRAVLWSQYLDAHTDLKALRVRHPELADELDAIRGELDARPDDPFGGVTGVSQNLTTDRRITLARRWDALVTQIRQTPGFADFLVAAPVVELLAAAERGPVVIVNVSEWRCDAMVVTTDGVTIVGPLAFSSDDAEEVARAYMGELRSYAASPPTADARMAMERAIESTLRWLWDKIAEPVLTAVGLTATPGPDAPWPRLWWCPTGPLSLLPLHAARGQEPGAGALDRVVSSYTPTLRALVNSRGQSSTVEAVVGPLLVVAVDDAPGRAELPGVADERDGLVELLGADAVLVLTGAAAGRREVREALTRHGCVHFGCHGSQILGSPSSAALHLFDGPLTLTELANESYRGRLATLSACQTATGGVRVPDEAVSLAAAMHYTGWPEVVATLWSVGDRAAAQVTIEVYRELAAGRAGIAPELAAYGLHAAVRQLRDAHPRLPSRWALFIHMGG